ncbi:hypothetical protein RN001_000783 [Aquatica leii]|uniref:Uncharacterized protein n=1 Tax=Aquatica leii TaxID=1421715 RepID=A0AAN7Q7F3_9COLE|nr:hypothetical protein RN001_000783 [Aquatica leii]
MNTLQQCCKTSIIKNLNEDKKYRNSIKNSLKMYLSPFSSNIKSIVYPICMSLEGSYNSDNSARMPTITSSDTETALSIASIDQLPLPTLVPRDHGNNCVLEITILEKHKKNCPNKKEIPENRDSLDDICGSYDVINRVVYKTCAGNDFENEQAPLKNSAKGFKLNDPNYFGKDLKENRSRIEAIPILPEGSSYNVARMETTEDKKPTDSVSIYIRVNKNDQVPKGFQKLHYQGDSCKLSNPNERSKQILALQKLINETTSAANISKTNKMFSPIVSESHVFNAGSVTPSTLPQTLFVSDKMKNSTDSLEIKTEADQVTSSKIQQTNEKCKIRCEENRKTYMINKQRKKSSNLSIPEKQENQGIFKRLIKRRNQDESTDNVTALNCNLKK